MKIIASTLFMLILAGCSPEDISENPSNNAIDATSHNYKKQGANVPTNPANPYDYTGTIYYQLIDEYYADNPSSSDLQQVISQVDTLAFQNAEFLELPDLSAYEDVSPADIHPYLNIGQDIRQHLAPEYGVAAKELYAALCNELTSLKGADATYQEAYGAIVLAEQIIISSHSLNPQEREAMLTTLSILRNAYYHDGKKRRRDRDWEWMTGHVVATANAALDSKPQAIIVSLASDIYQM